MILADKIINERKKNGWSQEELAEQLGVSRQSVSKWESAQSVPDLTKIVKMAEIFGVTTDYLLKDEIEAEDLKDHMVEAKDSDTKQVARKVSMEEANAYMDFWKKSRGKTATGVSLCVLSPTVLIVLAGLSEKYPEKISENMAAGIGMAFLFAMVIIAVTLFIKHASKRERFNYIETEPIETEYGVSGLVKEKKKAYENTHTILMIIGVALCIGCAVPTIICTVSQAEDFIVVCSVVALLVMVAMGSHVMIRTSAVWQSYEALLEENTFTKENKNPNSPEKAIMGIYWTVVTAIFLGYSFITKNWNYSWIIWMIAGVLNVAVRNTIKLVSGQKR